MKSGFVSIIGRPNAGKSTLLNKLTGEKISAISSKPQTTRNAIMGILTEKDYQVVFMDTPGIHKPKNKLGEFMINEVDNSLKSVDTIVLVVDACENFSVNNEIIENIEKCNLPILLVINKIDLIDKEDLIKVITTYSEKAKFDDIIPVSSINNDGVDIVLSEIIKRLDEGPMYFPDDIITMQPEKQIVSEIIREKALWCLDKEVPHGIAIEIEKFKTNDDILNISAVIYCEKKSHKGIIIGKNGSMLKKIGQLARVDIEKFMDTKVYLQLWVKIKEDWRNSDYLLKSFGFEKQN